MAEEKSTVELLSLFFEKVNARRRQSAGMQPGYRTQLRPRVETPEELDQANFESFLSLLNQEEQKDLAGLLRKMMPSL